MSVPRACLRAALLICLAGCRAGRPPSPPSQPDPAPADFITPAFTDATRAAGLNWMHDPCRTGRKLLPETVGGGGGFVDFDRDGWQDIVLVNGAPLPGYKGPTPRGLLLYRNNGDGTFTDVTKEAGLELVAYGMTVAVGDYDNDGFPDLYLTALNGGHLFHNERGNREQGKRSALRASVGATGNSKGDLSRRFRDVSKAAKVPGGTWGTGAIWVDVDRDGWLDLFVGNYVQWTPETDLPCGPENARQYCAPHQYRGARPYLYRNRGNGTFEDISEKAGVLNHPSKTLAVTLCDVNDDGWSDIYLANDTEPDVLLVNNRNGTFTDRALSVGVALGTDGSPTGSMGLDAATPMNDGRLAFAVGTFAGQEVSLFTATAASGTGRMAFENRKRESGLDEGTRGMTTFGLAFADVDLDGWPDLMVLNGHIDDDQSLFVGSKRVLYRQPPNLFQNRRDGTFRDVAAAAGIAAPLIGRGLAVGDYDNDGSPDFLVFENGGPVRLWRNATKTDGAWIGVELIGSKSPRDGTGAVVTLRMKNGTQSRYATTARSYLAACDPRIHFGVGKQAVEELTVRWPSGAQTVLKAPPLNRYLKVEEANGMTR